MSALAQLEAWSDYNMEEGLKLMNDSCEKKNKRDCSVQVGESIEPTKVSYQFSRCKTCAIILVSVIAMVILCHQGTICISR